MSQLNHYSKELPDGNVATWTATRNDDGIMVVDASSIKISSSLLTSDPTIFEKERVTDKVYVLVYEDAYAAKEVMSYHKTVLSAMAAAETLIDGVVKSGVDSTSIYVVPEEDSDYGYRIYCEEVQP